MKKVGKRGFRSMLQNIYVDMLLIRQIIQHSSNT